MQRILGLKRFAFVIVYNIILLISSSNCIVEFFDLNFDFVFSTLLLLLVLPIPRSILPYQYQLYCLAIIYGFLSFFALVGMIKIWQWHWAISLLIIFPSILYNVVFILSPRVYIIIIVFIAIAINFPGLLYNWIKSKI